MRAEDLADLHQAIARSASRGEIRRLVRSWSLERTKPRLDRLAQQARALAQRLGKAELDVTVLDHGTRIDTTASKEFWSAFNHVIRNAVDHGIEGVETRRAAGKPEHASLELVTRRDDATLVVEVRDDGQGIDWNTVRAKAKAAGAASESHQDLVDAILSDGFTTRDEVSATSGRGVGLAAIQAAVRDMNGTIEVESERGKGTKFRFTFEKWGHDKSTMIPILIA